MTQARRICSRRISLRPGWRIEPGLVLIPKRWGASRPPHPPQSISAKNKPGSGNRIGAGRQQQIARHQRRDRQQVGDRIGGTIALAVDLHPGLCRNEPDLTKDSAGCLAADESQPTNCRRVELIGAAVEIGDVVEGTDGKAGFSDGIEQKHIIALPPGNPSKTADRHWCRPKGCQQW